MFWITVKKLGSLWFAMLLLVVITLASIAGTICETRFNADLAQKYIYSAGWFNFWLGALAVNLFCAALIRCRPPKKHLTGFYITHAGIIILLAGALIDRLWGVEGFVHLYSTRPGTSLMELHEQQLKVTANGKSELTTFKVSTLSEILNVKSPVPGLAIKVLDAQPVTADEIAEPVPAGTVGKAALSFTLQGAMMGRHEKTMFLGDKLDFGMSVPTTLHFLKGMPPDVKPKVKGEKEQGDGAELELKFQGKSYKFPVKQHDQSETALDGLPGWKIKMVGYFPNFRMQDKLPTTLNDSPENPAVCFELIGPDAKGVKVDDPHADQGIPQEIDVVKPRREVFFVFMKQEQVMARAVHGEPTKAEAKLSVKAPANETPFEGPNGLAFYLGDDGQLRYLLRSRKGGDSTGTVTLEKAVPVGWAPGAEVIAHELLPNARRKAVFTPHPEMKSKDMESVNIGLKVYVGPPVAEPEMLPYFKKLHAGLIGLLALTIIGFAVFTVMGLRGGSKYWEWRALIGILLAGLICMPILYISQLSACYVAQEFPAKNLIWVGQTTVENASRVPQEIVVDGTKFNFEFVNSSVQLPFAVKLQKFNAPLDQGTTRFASFESYLSFEGRKDTIWLKPESKSAKEIGNSVITGAIWNEEDGRLSIVGPFGNDVEVDAADVERTDIQTQKISMNRPTTFPISVIAPYLGTCYKFSQASHHIDVSNPELSDPTYSGVQVLRDPGWSLKWIGCLLIVFGMVTMFWIVPYFKRAKKAEVMATLESRKKALAKKLGK